MATITELNGKVINEIIGLESGSDSVTFKCADGSLYIMHHSQDCCEKVSINDVIGDVSDLLNSPVLKAEETSSPEDFNDPHANDNYRESYTWTFYHLATIKGYLTIRWYGESNGYYSEDVSFEKVNRD